LVSYKLLKLRHFLPRGNYHQYPGAKMLKLSKNNMKNTNFEIQHKNLGPEQLRLTKSIITELTKMMETNQENQFFHSSSELMRLIATAIEFSSFVDYQSSISTIPFGPQAIEYSIDVLTEYMENNKHIQYDN